MTLFITGIGTEIGKTVCSAILVEYFKAEYWKPIQSGDLHYSDSQRIIDWTDENTVCHPETYRFAMAESPHQSSEAENIHIKLDKFHLPSTDAPLIIEGAGGLMVPLTQDIFMIDLIEKLNLPTGLVVRNYLGCINHTLLSIMALQQRNIKLKYLIFNGTFLNEKVRVITKFIEKETQIIKIPEMKSLNKQDVKTIAEQLKIMK